MARITRAAAHLSLEEVKSRLQNDPRPWCRQRWLIIYNALVDPRKAEEIAKHCGVSKATVHQVTLSTWSKDQWLLPLLWTREAEKWSVAPTRCPS